MGSSAALVEKEICHCSDAVLALCDGCEPQSGEGRELAIVVNRTLMKKA